eukprot:scaffold3000_cov134-Isochrysis_galbana.AAC.3
MRGPQVRTRATPTPSTPHPAGVHLSKFEAEVRYVLLQGCLHLGGRALACEGHLNGCARDHDDDVEGWHFLAHILYQYADLLSASVYIGCLFSNILQAARILHSDGVGGCARRSFF